MDASACDRHNQQLFCLLRRLSQRPTAEELKQRNILQGEAEQLLHQLCSRP